MSSDYDIVSSSLETSKSKKLKKKQPKLTRGRCRRWYFIDYILCCILVVRVCVHHKQEQKNVRWKIKAYIHTCTL